MFCIDFIFGLLIIYLILRGAPLNEKTIMPFVLYELLEEEEKERWNS
jgi:hypothetical protein